MDILVVSQNFWPENFRINDLVAELQQRGHQVTVLTGLPNYPEGEVFIDYARDPAAFSTYHGAKVVRVPHLPRGNGSFRLILNYVTFAISSCVLAPFKLRRVTFDAIFVFQTSPVTGGLAAIVMKWLRRKPIAFWVLDLWPQSLEAVGAVRSPRVISFVDMLVRFIYTHCDLILAQSKSFVEAIGKQVKGQSRIVYFPSWSERAPELDTVPLAPEVPHRPDLFTIVFTGNVGEAQDFGAVLAAIEELRREPIRWLIVGDGRKLSWLADEIANRGLKEQVKLLGRFPLERMPSFLRHADALLVSLRDEPIFALTIPGKVQSYLAAGRPILAMINGEGADVVTSAGAGLAAKAGDSASLAAAVRRLGIMSPEERVSMGQKGRSYAQSEFSRDVLIARLEQLLTSLASPTKRTDR